MSKKIIVAGGGAAGMMAAIAAAGCGCSVLLLEQNEKLGKKIFITGKGRCNVTNACDTEEIFKQVTRNKKFLYSAIYSFDNFRVMDFFKQQNIPLKIERGGRVFPVSDHSSDIIKGLACALRQFGVEVKLHTRIRSVEKIIGGSKKALQSGTNIGRFVVTDTAGRSYTADKVIVAAGGLSYPSTGSTGDGYLFARHFGHTIIDPLPGLCAMYVKENYVKKLQGVSLKNVRAGIYNGSRLLYEDFGEMLFTHFGVSGPMMLSASSIIGSTLQEQNLLLKIDLKPALSREQLDRRILRDFDESRNKQFKNTLNRLLPAKLIPVVIALSGIPPEKKVNEITKQERGALLELLKNFPAVLTGLREFPEAIITRGGVHVKEINPSTMESKLASGLYFAGEMLDVDALTGGFNLQIAWSTGYLAGISAGENQEE